MFQLKKIDIGSVALYSFIMFLIFGLIIFLPLGLMFSLVSSFIPDSGEFDRGILPIFSGVFIVIIPLFYAVFGTITNVIIAFVYNLLSLKFGGIKLTFEKLNEMGQIIE
ncbi:MAG: hypothetical protein H6613_09170 [Ignavibacteriales bacterium]|nr:hypothetical protein [Ignavibacteriota bacterium]MCB9248691.1 hypothetical protein [Ignavibacteriales bacterium]